MLWVHDLSPSDKTTLAGINQASYVHQQIKKAM